MATSNSGAKRRRTGKIQVSYSPRAPFLPFHSRSQRWGCMIAHRRAGKTVACVNDLVTRSLYTQKHAARYSYIGPYRKQTKKIAWDYLKQSTSQFEDKTLESDLSVRLLSPTGSEIALYGSDNVDALRGTYNDGVIIDEFGDCRPSLWGEVILPTLADRDGWCVFIGTPKGHNHFEEIWKRSQSEPDDWFSFMLRASESGILSPLVLAEQRKQMTEDQYQQEYECSFDAAVPGAYYASTLSELESHIRDIPYDPSSPVHVSWDLGYTDSTAMWFWQHRGADGGFAIIDYEEHDHQPLSFYFSLLLSKPYFNNYGDMWLPHDAMQKTMQTGRSTTEQVLQQRYRVRPVPNLQIQAGIDAVRLILPRCYFDRIATRKGVECLRAYHREYDEMSRVYRDKPEHDWASHGADSFRYFALSARESVKAPAPSSSSFILKPPVYTLDSQYEYHDRRSRRYASRRI